MPHSYDDSAWPIVVSRASGESTDEDMAGYLLMGERLLARRQPHVLIVDATAGRSLNSVHRKMVAEWNSRYSVALRRYRVGLVLVTPSALLRGMVTAIYWVSPAPFPYQPVATLEEAVAWANQQLAAAAAAS